MTVLCEGVGGVVTVLCEGVDGVVTVLCEGGGWGGDCVRCHQPLLHDEVDVPQGNVLDLWLGRQHGHWEERGQR